MSDNYTEPSDDQGDEDFKNLRAKAKKADQFERENAELTRKIAFIEAGIPTHDPRMQYFVKGYDGELTADAIKQAAVEAGFITVQAEEPDYVAQQAQQAQQRVMAASSGTQPEFDPDAIAYGMQQAMAEGGMEGLSAYAEQFGITFNSPSV